MRSVNLSEAEFYGKVSTPPANREAEPRECRWCGSQLAGRYQGVRFIGGNAKLAWRCERRPRRQAPPPPAPGRGGRRTEPWAVVRSVTVILASRRYQEPGTRNQGPGTPA